MQQERQETVVETLDPVTLYQACYEQFLGLSFPELLSRCYEEILPGMNRRHRGKLDSPLKLMEKVWSIDGKRGELSELHEVLKRTGLNLTPELLGEVADVVYYTAKGVFHPFYRNSLYLFIPNINMEEGLRVCDAKYHGRIKYGDYPDIKEVEIEALGLFLKGMSEGGHKLFLDRKLKRFEQVDLYRCWLRTQPYGNVRIKLDQLRYYFPF